MALKQHQLKANKATSESCREGKNRKKQPGKTVCGQDALQTRRAARADPKELANMLSQKALAGDLDSAKLLVTIANRAKAIKPGKKKRHGLTEAQQLALDPPWQGDPEQVFLPTQEEPMNPG